MQLAFRYRAFANAAQDNRSHFLLAGATLDALLSFADGAQLRLSATRLSGNPLAFTLALTPANIPDAVGPDGRPVMVGGQRARKVVKMIDLHYRVPLTLGGHAFTALTIRQRLLTAATEHNGPTRVDYALAPGGWFDAAGRQRVSNMATHPLVDAKRLAAGELTLNTLMLDITDGWQALHKDNVHYLRHAVRSAGSASSFKVFAHLAGVPLIWYAVVPPQLRGTQPVSPHVFYMPADHAEGQNLVNGVADDRQYLTSNARHFENDGDVLFSYLDPPVADDQVRALLPRMGTAIQRRNVVGFAYAVKNGRRSGEITSDHWMIGAGLARAFEHTGSGKPAQLLIVPQRLARSTLGSATGAHVQPATHTLIDVLETNTTLTVGGGDVLLAKGKLVLSGYSESGVDLWPASRANRDQLKAIVAIEPQNMNTLQNDYRKKNEDGSLVNPDAPPAPLGKEVIPDLLRRKVAVYVIGRHHLHYGPQIAERAAVRLLPAQPATLFAYPPDPAASTFVKYRVHRIVDPASDPFLRDAERELLDDLARRGIRGAAALSAIFGPKGNQDRSPVSGDPDFGDGVERWYSHHFALTGGDELTLDPAGVYGKPVKYRTWFQVAVHEIG